MITEFTCGIYHAKFNEIGGPKWFLTVNQYTIAIIEPDGKLIRFLDNSPLLTQPDLIEIAVLMNNIKRQYKQLQTT